MSRYLIAVVLGVGFLSPFAPAGGQKSDPAPLDADFLKKAAAGHNAEIQFGKIAETKGSDSVKTFATHLIKEHQGAYDELAKLLKTRNLGIVAGLEQENRDEAKRLASLSGAEFDRAYLNLMVRNHERGEKLYDTQAKQGQEADVRDYAKSTLTAIRHHLKQARELQTSLTTK